MSDINFMDLQTDRLILRRFRETDAAEFFEYRTDPQVALYQGEGWTNYTIEQAVEFVKEQMNSQPGIPDTWFQIAIELRETGKLIGDCGIHTLSLDPKQVEIGFTLDRMQQGKGLGTEAVKCLLEYVFKDLDMYRVIASVDVRNYPSFRLLERIGMRREGHFIKNIWYKGEYASEYLYAQLKEEWE